MGAKEKIQRSIEEIEAQLDSCEIIHHKDLIEMLGKLRLAAFLGGSGEQIAATQTAGGASGPNKMLWVKIASPGAGRRLWVKGCFFGFDDPLRPKISPILKIIPHGLEPITLSAAAMGVTSLPLNLLLPDDSQCLFNLLAGGSENVGRLAITYSIV